MKNAVLGIVLFMLLLSGCAGAKQYLVENASPLVASSRECVMDADSYELGLAWRFSYDAVSGGSVEYEATEVRAFLICGEKITSVVCDVTKPPEEKPCQGIQKHILQQADSGIIKQDAVPVAWRQQ